MRPSYNLAFLPLFLLTACIDKGDTSDEDSGQTDINQPVDADGDGFFEADDCDDTNAEVNSDADELCADEIDNDCDGEIDEDDATDTSTWYADVDSDGYGHEETTTTACEAPSGYVSDATDCDDEDAAQHPDADEYCNGEDDDCDGETDEAGALDESTWYADTDDDGYGDEASSTLACDQPSGFTELSTDCDDSNPQIHPDADEMCDGVDTDCDSSTDEEGLVSLEDSDGALWDMSSDFNGTATVPATPVLDSEGGTYWFCEGVHTLNASIEASVELASLTGDPDSTVLYGADMGTVLSIEGDGLEVHISDLGVMNGYGSGDLPYATTELSETGGGIFCNGDTELSLDGVRMSQNTAYVGGAIASAYCEIDIVSTIIDQNSAEVGAAILLSESNLSMSYTDINENTAETSGGIYVYSYEDDLEFEMSESLIYDNIGDSTVGMVNGGTGSIEGTCYGSSGSDAGFLSNEVGDYGALTLSGDDISFDSISCDWGTEDAGDDNDPTDIWIWGTSSTTGIDAVYEYRIGEDYNISCEDARCGSQSIYTLADSSGDAASSTDARGNVFLAETTETLDEFSVFVDPESICEVDFYVLSRSDLTSDWDIEYASSDLTSAGEQWMSSGVIGIAMDEGNYYALVYGWDCELTYYYDALAGSSTMDGGFGTSWGRWYDTAFSSSYSGSVDDVATDYPDTRYYMTVSVSR